MSLDTLDEGIELNGLLDCKHWKDCIILRTIADELASFSELCLDIKSLDRDLTRRWYDLAR